MFNSRKGVSEVVANVLIVLLVIVGIAVIWSVVKPTIDKGAAGVQADCFTLAIEPVSCDVTGTTATVTVKRDPGAGTFETVEILFSDGTDSGTVTSGLAPSALTELSQSTTAALTLPTGVAGTVTANTVVRVAGQLCQITSQPVTCT